MTRAVTLSYEDAAAIGDLMAQLIPPMLAPEEFDVLTRFADALEAAENERRKSPSVLFPEPVVIGASGIAYRVRSRVEDVGDSR